jgi:hypothetical protein
MNLLKPLALPLIKLLHKLCNIETPNSPVPSNNRLMKLERTINALNGINHGISSAIETDSGITPLQVYCMIELVSEALLESLSELGEVK